MTVPSTPVGDYLASAARPGASLDNRYLVLPHIVLEHLPAAVQHDLVHVLRRIHDIADQLPWPQSYRVEAIRWKSLHGLDETGLRELGVAAELDFNGELIHRDESTGRPLAAAELARPMSESCPDPLYSYFPPGCSHSRLSRRDQTRRLVDILRLISTAVRTQSVLARCFFWR